MSSTGERSYNTNLLLRLYVCVIEAREFRRTGGPTMLSGLDGSFQLLLCDAEHDPTWMKGYVQHISFF